MSMLAPKKKRRAKGKPKLRTAVSSRQKEKDAEKVREQRAGRLMVIAVAALAVLAIVFTIVIAAS